LTWACFDAKAAACTSLTVNDYSSDAVYAQCIHWAYFHARVVLALGTQVWYFYAGEGHEDADAACFGPHPSIMVYAASKFAASTSAACGVVS
jgi:hypothetical protein